MSRRKGVLWCYPDQRSAGNSRDLISRHRAVGDPDRKRFFFSCRLLCRDNRKHLLIAGEFVLPRAPFAGLLFLHRLEQRHILPRHKGNTRKRQTDSGVHLVANRVDHTVQIDSAQLPGPFGHRPPILKNKVVLLYLQGADPSLGIADDLMRRPEVAESEPAIRRRGRFLYESLEDLLYVLAGGLQTGADLLDFTAHILVIEVLLNHLELAVVVGFLLRAPASHHGHLADLFIVEQPIRDIDHDVAHADNGYPAPDFIRALTERRKLIEVIDDIFSVVDSQTIFPGDPELLGALGPRRDHYGAESDSLQIFQRDRFSLAHRYMAKIEELGIGENPFKVLSEPFLHLLLVKKYPVFRQTARLDVPIEQNHDVPCLGKLTRAIDPRGTGSDDSYQMPLCFCVCHNRSFSPMLLFYCRNVKDQAGSTQPKTLGDFIAAPFFPRTPIPSPVNLYG